MQKKSLYGRKALQDIIYVEAAAWNRAASAHLLQLRAPATP